MNFALAKTGMSTRAAEPTHALHGFCTKLIDLEFRFPQHRMAVAFDLPGPTFRSLKLPSYKSGRPPMPGDLRSQIELIREACGLFGLPSLSEPSYEGDDILATCATAAAKAGFASVTIVTGDKDMLQLVTPDDAPTRVAIWDDRAKRVMDGEAVRAKFGVAPHQIADYLALTGDASDAVPGVPWMLATLSSNQFNEPYRNYSDMKRLRASLKISALGAVDTSMSLRLTPSR